MNETTFVVFFKNVKQSGNDKNTMTSWNSNNEIFMEMCIQQLKDSGDF